MDGLVGISVLIVACGLTVLCAGIAAAKVIRAWRGLDLNKHLEELLGATVAAVRPTHDVVGKCARMLEVMTGLLTGSDTTPVSPAVPHGQPTATWMADLRPDAQVSADQPSLAEPPATTGRQGGRRRANDPTSAPAAAMAGVST